MHQLSVRPTWQTALVRKMLKTHPSDFQIYFMDGLYKNQYNAFKTLINYECMVSHDVIHLMN